MEKISESLCTPYSEKTINSLEPMEDMMQTSASHNPLDGLIWVLRQNGLRCRKRDFYKAGGRQGAEVKAYRDGKEFAVAYVGNSEYEILRIR